MLFPCFLLNLEVLAILLRLQAGSCVFSLFGPVLLVRNRITRRYWPWRVAYVDVEVDVDIHVRDENVVYAIFRGNGRWL